MTRQKVLFIVPALRRAGAERQIVSLVNGLTSDRFEKHLLSYTPGDELKAELDQKEIKTYELDRRHKLDIALGKKIGHIIDENAIDIVHCTLLNALLYGSMGTYFAKQSPRLVSVIHTTRNANIKIDIADYLIHRWLLKQCDQVWFVSSNQADLWMRKLPFVRGRQRIIHNGIDIEHFDPARFHNDGEKMRMSLGIAHSEKVLCSVAGFRSEKLHSVLIDSFFKVLSQGTPCRLLLAGTGPMEEAIRAKVSALNLEKDVLFLGSLADVRTLLAISDCMVLASEAETFSVAMLEAMAMEVPVITTIVGGASEAIDDGVSGYLVRPRDDCQLANRIREILNNDVRRHEMGKRARKVVVDRFSVKKMVDESEKSFLAVTVDC